MKKYIIILITIGIVAAGYLGRNKIKRWWHPDMRTTNQTEVKLIFKTIPSIDSLAGILESKGIVKSKKVVLDYVRANFEDYKVAPGKYIVLAQTQLPNLLEGFQDIGNGTGKNELQVNVVFNNCRDIYDVGRAISKCILADSASIVDYLKSDNFLAEMELTEEELPSIFLPKTYKMEFDTDAEGFVRYMLERYDEFWTKERLQLLKKNGLNSKQDAATLASLVYLEQSRVPEEWSVISRLYLNRLESGILLQSDPTFKHCWGDELDGVEQLLDVHKNIDCEYNTYKYLGLPPGPIFIVSEKVLDSVIRPSFDDYLFMMAKPGGVGHNFAKTNRQHNKNVAIYRKWEREYLKNKNND